MNNTEIPPTVYVVERCDGFGFWYPILGDEIFDTRSQAEEACASWSEMDYTEKLRVAEYIRNKP